MFTYLKGNGGMKIFHLFLLPRWLDDFNSQSKSKLGHKSDNPIQVSHMGDRAQVLQSSSAIPRQSTPGRWIKREQVVLELMLQHVMPAPQANTQICCNTMPATPHTHQYVLNFPSDCNMQRMIILSQTEFLLFGFQHTKLITDSVSLIQFQWTFQNSQLIRNVLFHW